jgi:hypothetical protein
VEIAEADRQAAGKTREEAEKRYDAMTRARKALGGDFSDDYRGAKLTWDRYVEEEKARAAAVRQAQAELQAARTALDLYQIRSSVRGVIRAIDKHQGEAVRPFEPVFLVRTEERLPAPPAAIPPQRLVQVPSARAGLLLLLATKVKPGERVVAGRLLEVTWSFLAVEVAKGEKVPPGQRVAVPGRTGVYRRWQEGDELVPDHLVLARERRRLRRLEVGDKVEEGQLLGLVNPALALDDVAVKVAALEIAEADRQAAVKTRDEAEKRYDAMTRARKTFRRSVPDDAYRGAKLTWDRYIQEEKARAAAVRQRQGGAAGGPDDPEDARDPGRPAGGDQAVVQAPRRGGPGPGARPGAGTPGRTLTGPAPPFRRCSPPPPTRPGPGRVS